MGANELLNVKGVAEIAHMANTILVVNEMIKNLSDGKLEPWSPVNIIVDAVGKDNLQEALSHHLGELKKELKEDITLS